MSEPAATVHGMARGKKKLTRKQRQEQRTRPDEIIATFGCPQETAEMMLMLCEERVDLLEAQLVFLRNAQRVWASDASQPALDRALSHMLELTFDHVSSTLDAFDEIGPLAELGDHTDLPPDVVIARLRAALDAAKQRVEEAVPDEIAEGATTVRYGEGGDTQISSTD